MEDGYRVGVGWVSPNGRYARRLYPVTIVSRSGRRAAVKQTLGSLPVAGVISHRTGSCDEGFVSGRYVLRPRRPENGLASR